LPEPNLQRQQSVLNLLKNFKGIDPLKKLFWTELNYDRVNESLSRRGWSENVAKLLAEDPVLFASGANDFHIIYGRLASDKLLMGDERPVVSKLLHEHPYALFIFSNSKQEHFHFLNVKYDDDAQKRRMFRRITVGPNEHLRTASERIALLDLADISPDLFGLSPLAIQQRNDIAFDVEPVTREFFTEYHRLFTEVEESITGFGRDKERRHLYTQRLFNRLMFIAFIQKKGWLKINGDAEYLAALWKLHLKDSTVSDKNFYRDRLKPLFFFGLNSSNEVNQIGINKGAFLKTLIGDVPYLNGGLFEEDEDDKNSDIKITDKAVSSVLNDLFAKFNFTVTESTPLDVEVAVDPEMLGKIFEELVTGRHESGSYYTPKPIVSFMCREALKGFLWSKTKGESEGGIARFVDKHESDDLRNAENILDALRSVKVCDPACGSGAYLLGMLHELIDLRASLFQSRKLDAKSVYERKLEIIRTNVYGVDIDPFAVNIARLRLWLSLAVDFEGDRPEPLPNLDYKVEIGDSLLGPNPSGGLELGFRKQLIDDFLKFKAEYLTAHHSQKRELKQSIEKVKADIASFSGHGKSQLFDWAVEFAEVFVAGGFDITIANPPYVRMELFKEIKPVLRVRYSAVHAERADLYCYFYARAIEMLADRGMITFISSNKWLRAAYGKNLRHYIASHCDLMSITDFGDLPVIQGATAYPMIMVARKSSGENRPIFTQVTSLSPPYPDVLSVVGRCGIRVEAGSVVGSEWSLGTAESAILARAVTSSGTTLGEYAKSGVCRGIVSGLTEAFVIDNEVRARLIALNPRNKPFIKPFLNGKNIRRWNIETSNRWLLYLPHSVDLKGHSEILDHLRPFKKRLEERATKQAWFELQQPQEKFTAVFESTKIVFPDIAKDPRFTLDVGGHYISNTAYTIPTDDLYLLGVLNSSTVEDLYRTMSAQIRGGYLRFFTHYVERIPIPNASVKDKDSIAELVQSCLENNGRDVEEFESEINGRVARLYGVAVAPK
jgi:methylase of polypeptide subunit release factors